MNLSAGIDCEDKLMSHEENVRLRRLLFVSFLGMILVVLVYAMAVQAQNIIGAKAGVIQFLKGDVCLDGKLIRIVDRGSHIQMENGQILSAKHGFAEIVLAPNAFLWVGENTSFKLRENKLVDIQFEIIQGSAVVGIMETERKNPITAYFSKNNIKITEHGVYRINSHPAELKVYDGNALVRNETVKTRIRKGQMLNLEAQSAPGHFDMGFMDALRLFSMERAATITDWMARSADQAAKLRNVDKETERKLSSLQQETERKLSSQQRQEDNEIKKVQQENEKAQREYQLKNSQKTPPQ
jgi:hypothetical protein